MGFSGVLFISGIEMSLAPFSRLAVPWSLGSGSPSQFGGVDWVFYIPKVSFSLQWSEGVKFSLWPLSTASRSPRHSWPLPSYGSVKFPPSQILGSLRVGSHLRVSCSSPSVASPHIGEKGRGGIRSCKPVGLLP